MTRTVMIVALIAALVLSFGGPALSVAPAWAQAKATEDELVPLKQQVAGLEQEVASIEAQLQQLSSREASASRAIEVPTIPECINVPEALLVVEAAMGHCR